MEFKFRAVDDRTAPYLYPFTSSPSSTYFSEQALRANHTTAPSFMPNQRDFYTIQLQIEKERIRQEFIAAEYVCHRLRVLEEEMTRKLMMERVMPNPRDFYTIQLEIEKERIGQEFIAAENVRRRLRVLEEEMTRKLMIKRVMPNPRELYTIQLEIEKERIGQELIGAENVRWRLQVLEEEVTRKLMMEREMPMHRSSRTGISIDERPTMQLHSRYPLMHQPDNHWLEHRLAFSGNSNLGFGHNVLPPILEQFSDAAKDEIKSALDFTQKDKLIMLAKPDPNLFGAKKKTTTLPAVSQQLPLTSLKKPKEWSCALCQVSAISEQGLNEHLQGKKHKAKEAGLLTARKAGKNPASQTKKSRKRIEPAESRDGAGSEMGTKHEEESLRQADKTVVVSEQKTEGVEDSKNENEEPPKQKNLKAANREKNGDQAGRGKRIELAESRDGAGSEMEAKQEVESLRQADKTVVVSDQKTEGVEDSKNENEEPPKQKNLKAENRKKNVMRFVERVKRNQANEQLKFWCENCQVGTNAAVAMESHKKGKKHIARLKESNQNGEAISTMTSPMIVKSSEPTENAEDIDVVAQEANEETIVYVPTKNAKDTDGVAKGATENVTGDSDSLGSSRVANAVDMKNQTP